MVNNRPFCRLRLKNPTSKAKYLSRKGDGSQLYIPPGLRPLLVPGCKLGITEGEFKALALVEAGFPCAGTGGITSACPGGALLPALVDLIAQVRPAELAFIGDNDTCLIFDFAREAVKLATLSGVKVILPRIPYGHHCKGPDDFKDYLKVAFKPSWMKIMESAEPVTADTKPTALAVRLLQRELDALARLEGPARDKAREKIVKLAVAMSSDALAVSEVEKIAIRCLGYDAKPVFRAALKQGLSEAKREAAERATTDALAALNAEGKHPPYFDGTNYWRLEYDGAFGKLCRPDALLELNTAGFSQVGDPSPCDVALNELQKSNRVDFAGPMCGRMPGLHHDNGLRILVTRGPTFIEGVCGDFPTINALIGNLFGRSAGDEHNQTQFYLFISWLKLAREALRHPDRHRPGQVLALVGPPDCGKSLLQNLIITPSIGGRCAEPSLFFTGKTTFNADLWGAEHLMIGDKALDLNGAQRATLRNELKRAVAEPVYPLHGKCRDGLTSRPIWRISISANEDPVSASNLPTLDASFADKIIYLKCYAPPKPFHEVNVPGAREAFADQLRAELPAFLAAVDAFDIPAALRKARFGITEWHHPAVLELLHDGDPLGPIAEVLQSWVDSWPEPALPRELLTVHLFKELDNFTGNDLTRLKICSGPNNLGHQLAKLALKSEWTGRIEHFDQREGGRTINKKLRGWKISR